MVNTYAIVGGGIAGASIAYHLSKVSDGSIILFEQRKPATETTIKSVAQFGWYGDETQYRMKRYGMELYNQFFENQQASPRYESMGILVAATDPKNSDRLKRAMRAQEAEDIGKIGEGLDRDLIEYIPGNELEKSLLLPPVNTDAIAGGMFRPKVGYMSRPHELAYEFIERAKENGVDVRNDTRIIEITTHDDRATGLVTEDGNQIDIDEVICAAGPWNIKLTESVGLDIPVQHTIAPIIKLQPIEPLEYTLPAINHYESPYAFHRRSADEFLIGYNPSYDTATEYDPDAMGDEVPADIREEGLDLLATLVPGIADAEVVDEWVGIRSVTPDGNPVVGWTELEGFSIAAFHTSGIQLSPAVGRMIASQLVDDDSTSFYDALSISRFEGYVDYRS